MSEANLAASRRVIEDGFNNGDLAVVDAVCAPNAVHHDPAMPEDARGTAALKQQISGRSAICSGRQGAMSSAQLLFDVAGRCRSPAAMPGYSAGCAPGNGWMVYPADPPTVDEIVAVMR